MLDVEIVTDKFLSKDFIEEILRKNEWSSWSEKFHDFDVVNISNKKGTFVIEIYLNKLDDKGNEIYDGNLDPKDIEEIKNEPQFKGFKPYFTLFSYCLDAYDDAVDFLYILKKEGLRVFFRFCGYGDLKELKNQL